MVRVVQRVVQRISDISFGASFLILAFVTVLVNVDVLLRHFFSIPITWSTEVSEAALLYMTFLGTERVLRDNKHVTVDIVLVRLNTGAKRPLFIISSFIGLLVSLTMLVFGAATAWNYYKRGIYNPSATELPLAPILAVIPYGGFFLSWEFMRKIIETMRDIKRG
ncbi:MAG: TRAP transporter small permease [Deltaproteobacteria bacterium]|nr:TRAP transporter small permease [Deltaproteobacteria bacterium]